MKNNLFYAIKFFFIFKLNPSLIKTPEFWSPLEMAYLRMFW